MSTDGCFPRADAELNNYFSIAIPYLTANKARLVTTPAATAALTNVTVLYSTPVTGWTTLYPLTQNAALATGTARTSKNLLRDQIKAALRQIYDDIPKSIFTQADRDTLNLPQPNNSRTPASIPAEQPSINITLREHLAITLTIVDEAHPQTLAKPADADAIEIEGAFLPVTATAPAGFPQETDFRHLSTTGRSSYTRTYAQDQLRGTEYIRARYLNSRKEPGRWSEIVQVVVS